ncbi:MAG: ATP-dependent DNA helicase PcrA [Microgenomates group bacterium ADurb.Bin219]|nr:MAG: ATP-dependent DNA helicase PcrA [Microgenomates group bacterium ADurb.Bin219]HNP89351.1 UvrD-helicase domain-containing protein [Candidatus Woesebacteria bacterium]
MKDILADLNPAQQEAVVYHNGPLLVLAGAGSGKTRVLIYRTAWLIAEKKVPPENILLLTFTNKAAGEMKDRLQKILASQLPARLSSFTSHLPYAGTFHSFCAKILRKEGKNIGIPPNYLIYDDQDQIDAVKEILNQLQLSPKEFNPRAVLTTISEAKNELISELEYPQYVRGYWQETVARVYRKYQNFLKENEALDFDDLIFKTVNLFKKFPEILGDYQNKYRYLLVDEYQDTNHAQYVLTKLLAKRFNNLTVVGDMAQSIYMWRGADFKNVLKLKEDFPDLKTINLEQNYRSTQKILDTAYSVISHNSSHPVLKLWTENPKGENAFLYEAANELEEAEFIVRQILNRVSSNSRLAPNYSYFAILYRTNAQSRVLEEAFLQAGIPYSLVGGTRFYERKEIKDVLSYLRLLANPKDMVSYKRIEKLGKGRLEKFLKLQKSLIGRKNLTTMEILEKTLKETGYLDLYDAEDEEDLTRLENIKELGSVATNFPELNQFLENVALVEQEQLPDHPVKDKKTTDKRGAVTLMTLHAAKGLEFPVVFMVGMEEGLFPHSRSLLDNSQLEEERRLCYVGITRAKEKVYLTYARRRLYFGQRSANLPSRFLMDIPQELLQLLS